MGQRIADPTLVKTMRSGASPSVQKKTRVSSQFDRPIPAARQIPAKRPQAGAAGSTIQGPFFPSSPRLAGPGLDSEGRLVPPEQVAMYALSNTVDRGVQEAKESLKASGQYFVDELKGLNDVTFGALWDLGTQLGEGKADLTWLADKPLETLKEAAKQAVTEIAQMPGKAFSLHGGRAAGQIVGTAATAAVPFAKTPIYRVWGGAAKEFNPSWTTVDPKTVPNYRSGAGLGRNTGEYLTSGTINDLRSVVNGTRFTKAKPGPGGPGGLPEVNIPNAAKRVKVAKRERLRERL
jgi:hypothetical protein